MQNRSHKQPRCNGRLAACLATMATTRHPLALEGPSGGERNLDWSGASACRELASNVSCDGRIRAFTSACRVLVGDGFAAAATGQLQGRPLSQDEGNERCRGAPRQAGVGSFRPWPGGWSYTSRGAWSSLWSFVAGISRRWQSSLPRPRVVVPCWIKDPAGNLYRRKSSRAALRLPSARTSPEPHGA